MRAQWIFKNVSTISSQLEDFVSHVGVYFAVTAQQQNQSRSKLVLGNKCLTDREISIENGEIDFVVHNLKATRFRP